MTASSRSARRPAQAHRYSVPERADVLYWFTRLASGDVSRESAAEWAVEYVLYDDPEIYPTIKDRAVWDALKSLSGAAKRSDNAGYLYDAGDFRQWAQRLSSAP